MVVGKEVSLVDAKVYEKVDLRVDVRVISMVVEKEFYSAVSKVVGKEPWLEKNWVGQMVELMVDEKDFGKVDLMVGEKAHVKAEKTAPKKVVK